MRYYNFTPTEFVNDAIYEAPVEAMGKIIEKKDKEFEDFLGNAGAASEINIDPHAKDAEAARKIREKYSSSVENVVEQAMSDKLDVGKFDRMIKNTQRDIQKDTTSGDIYNINQRNADIKKLKEDLVSQYQKDKSSFANFDSADDITRYVDHKYSGYKNAQGFYNTSPTLAMVQKEEDLDILKKVLSDHTKMDFSTKTDKEIGNLIETFARTEKGLTSDEIRRTLDTYINGSNNLQDFITERVDVKRSQGIDTNFKTEEEFLKNSLIGLAEEKYGVSVTKSSRTLKGNPRKSGKGSGGGDENGNNFGIIKTINDVDKNQYYNDFKNFVRNQVEDDDLTSSTFEGDMMDYYSKDSEKLQEFHNTFLEQRRTQLEKEEDKFLDKYFDEDAEVDFSSRKSIKDNLNVTEERAALSEYDAIAQNMAVLDLVPKEINTENLGSELVSKEELYTDKPDYLTKEQYSAMNKNVQKSDSNNLYLDAQNFNSKFEFNIDGKDKKLVFIPGEGERAKKEFLASSKISENDFEENYISVNVGSDGIIQGQDLVNTLNRFDKESNKKPTIQRAEGDISRGAFEPNEDNESEELKYEISTKGNLSLPKEGFTDGYMPGNIGIVIGDQSFSDVKIDMTKAGVGESYLKLMRQRQNALKPLTDLNNSLPSGKAINSDGSVNIELEDPVSLSLGGDEVSTVVVEERGGKKRLFLDGAMVNNSEHARTIILNIIRQRRPD